MRMILCRSMNTGLVVGALRGDENTQTLPAEIQFIELCALTCSGDDETFTTFDCAIDFPNLFSR